MSSSKSPGRGPAFKAGDTITNGTIWLTVYSVTKKDYAFDDAIRLTRFYMPIAIVDRLWTLAELDGEIVE